MKAIQLIELHSMKDILLLSKHCLFRMDFGNTKIYYSGATNEDFVGLDLYITNEDYSGNLYLSPDGEIESKPIKSSLTITVIKVKDDTLLRGILANYLVRKYGLGKEVIQKAVQKAQDGATKILAGEVKK